MAWPLPVQASSQLASEAFDMVTGLLLLALASLSQAADTLPLTAVVALARAANPALAAARLRTEALAERVSQVGALPDPELSLGLMNRPLFGFGTAEPMTMNQVQVRQMFPWPGKLGFGQERARLLSSAAGLDALELESQLVARVRTLYVRIAAIDRSLAIIERTRDLLRDFFRVSEARYAVGEGLQQDVLQAQVSIARMSEELTVMGQDRIALAARLNALLGREPDQPIPALELPAPGDGLPPVDSLVERASKARPALLASRERTRAAEAGYQAARREIYPDLMVSLGYGQRDRFDDMASLMVGFSIPLRPGSRQLAMRREMAAMRASEEAMARDLANETYAMLTEQRAEAERARELTRLYATSILPQARAAVESALSAYRVGRVDYMTLVESEMTVNRYEVELVRLAASYQEALAMIDALAGAGGGS